LDAVHPERFPVLEYLVVEGAFKVRVHRDEGLGDRVGVHLLGWCEASVLAMVTSTVPLLGPAHFKLAVGRELG
jgi:hypothetical protein